MNPHTDTDTDTDADSGADAWMRTGWCVVYGLPVVVAAVVVAAAAVVAAHVLPAEPNAWTAGLGSMAGAIVAQQTWHATRRWLLRHTYLRYWAAHHLPLHVVADHSDHAHEQFRDLVQAQFDRRRLH